MGEIEITLETALSKINMYKKKYNSMMKQPFILQLSNKQVNAKDMYTNQITSNVQKTTTILRNISILQKAVDTANNNTILSGTMIDNKKVTISQALRYKNIALMKQTYIDSIKSQISKLSNKDILIDPCNVSKDINKLDEKNTSLINSINKSIEGVNKKIKIKVNLNK